MDARFLFIQIFIDICNGFMKFEKHIFICTNQRGEGERKSCGEKCGMELVKEFKKLLKERGLKGRMRAQRAGCLDACDYGPSIVVYPEGTYYGGVQPGDVEEIVSEHLIHNRPVERLLIDFPV
jgi:(2Fe-2S) ferredoxin